jgi:hypothetical protein
MFGKNRTDVGEFEWITLGNVIARRTLWVLHHKPNGLEISETPWWKKNIPLVSLFSSPSSFGAETEKIYCQIP